jgi:histidyl-tRNA synthetase
LRPELTPSLARMVAQKQSDLVFPMRWWSFGPFWRYERPQKGRSREFFQWNIDMIGVTSPESDAELIAIAASFFQEVGLTSSQVNIFINDRMLTNQSLAEIGIAKEDRSKALHLIDRRDKMTPQEWESSALDSGLTTGQLTQLVSVLADPELWQKSEALKKIFKVLEILGIREYVHYNAHVIRGLDYYTTVVLEAYDVEGGRAILGGGHYDNLVEAVGGDPLPATGFAMGDMMIAVVLEKYGLLPDFSSMADSVLVTVFNETTLSSSLSFSAELRRGGVRKVICYPEVAKLQKQLKYADRNKIRFAVIIGPDEEANQQVVVKDLAARTQSLLSRPDAVDFLQKMLA